MSEAPNNDLDIERLKKAVSAAKELLPDLIEMARKLRSEGVPMDEAFDTAVDVVERLAGGRGNGGH